MLYSPLMLSRVRLNSPRRLSVVPDRSGVRTFLEVQMKDQLEVADTVEVLATEALEVVSEPEARAAD